MFTGLIEAIGEIKKRQTRGGVQQFSIEVMQNLSSDWVLKKGDSISVDGVCLTVVESKDRTFSVDISSETEQRSTLKFLRIGDRVNLERALKIGERLGGHFVTGHIDGTGRIRRFSTHAPERILEISLEKKFLKYAVEKGSIAIDGISLTVAGLNTYSVSIAIIPFTFNHTTLRWKKVGDAVNIELDIIGKYIERLLSPQKELMLTHLKEAGFI